jgi:hypothetical protein
LRRRPGGRASRRALAWLVRVWASLCAGFFPGGARRPYPGRRRRGSSNWPRCRRRDRRSRQDFLSCVELGQFETGALQMASGSCPGRGLGDGPQALGQGRQGVGVEATPRGRRRIPERRRHGRSSVPGRPQGARPGLGGSRSRARPTPAALFGMGLGGLFSRRSSLAARRAHRSISPRVSRKDRAGRSGRDPGFDFDDAEEGRPDRQDVVFYGGRGDAAGSRKASSRAAGRGWSVFAGRAAHGRSRGAAVAQGLLGGQAVR